MSQQLFREEALLASVDARFGKVVFHQPMLLRILVVLIALVFFTFLIFAATAELKRTEHVRGNLVPVLGEVKVYSSRSGIFQDILVEEGQSVKQGDMLAVITNNQADETGRQFSLTFLDSLNQQIEQLQMREELIRQQALLDTEQLTSRIAGLEAGLVLLQDEYQVVLQRTALAEEEYQRIQNLFERGAISGSEHNQGKSAWYNLLQSGKAAQRNVESHRQALLESRQQLALLPLQTENDILQIQGSLLQLKQRRDEIRAQRTSTLTAPVEGVVTNLLASPGDNVEPHIPVLTLLPPNYQLEARLYLPSSSLGEVETGQEIMLTYDAYPYQTHGSFKAEIYSISSAVIDPREFLIPMELAEPVFLARANLEDQPVDKQGEKQLLSGMQFSADIITGRESILQRLLAPLTNLGKRL